AEVRANGAKERVRSSWQIEESGWYARPRIRHRNWRILIGLSEESGTEHTLVSNAINERGTNLTADRERGHVDFRILNSWGNRADKAKVCDVSAARARH